MVKTISHRELRNNSAEVLREAKSGQVFEITNHGEVVARLSPAVSEPFSGLQVRRSKFRGGFRELPKFSSAISLRDLLEDLKGEY